MILFLGQFFLAWSTSNLPSPPPTIPKVVTYNVSTDFCHEILPKFFNDYFLSWKQPSCTDISKTVRNSFDAWQYNTLLYFVQVEGIADVAVTASLNSPKHQLAYATTGNVQNAVIGVSDDKCWYSDRNFCSVVREYQYLIFVLMSFFFVVSLVQIFYVCWRPASTIIDATTRIVAWSLAIGLPLSLFSVLPCFECFDLQTVMIHEVGHVIGLHHPDTADTTYCGCQENATICPHSKQKVRDDIMHSTFKHRPTSCLTRDDVDGARTLWGGNCTAPVACYYSVSFEGLSRVSNSIVYAFILAWFIVFVRNMVRRRAIQKKSRSSNKIVRRSVELVNVQVATNTLPPESNTLPPLKRSQNDAAVRRAQLANRMRREGNVVQRIP